MEPPLTVSWIDPRLGVGKSGVDGDGEFASAPIRAGERLKILGGRLVDGSEMARIAASEERFSALRVGPDVHLLMAWEDPGSRGNHSCDPNAWLESEFVVVARKDIAAGEEVTTDYATMTVDPEWRMECRCGRTACRGTVTGEDWKLPELRERYRGHFVPWIETLPLD